MIAKPFDDSHEQHFYESLLPEDLRPFVPKYFGIKGVTYVDDDSDSDLAAPLTSSISVPSDTLSGDSADAGVPTHQLEANPWALRCLGKERARLRQAGTHLKPCILLEDLTSQFHFPCVLDIKMGTRAHPDDMAAPKAQRSQAKCLSSTSSSLGLRLCGMQRYDAALHDYHYVDKYHGRDLQPEQVVGSIAQFLGPNHNRAAEVVSSWLASLERLAAVLRGHSGYRFYSSSLLLMYEGEPDCSPRADVRMIDFAHTRAGTDEGADEGLLFGLSNLCRLLREALATLAC